MCNKGVRTELLQHGSQQQGQVSASLAQEPASSHNSVTQRQAPYDRDILAASPANENRGPILGILPIRLVSALGEQHQHLSLWASTWCLWGGPQHVPVQVP